MALQVTPVNRNLQTRVTFMCLEFEDLFVVLGAAAVMNIVGHFVGGEIAGLPMNLVLQYGVPLFMVPWSECWDTLWFPQCPTTLLGNRRAHTKAPSDLPISNPVFGNHGLESRATLTVGS